jgi:hypothetical protein
MLMMSLPPAVGTGLRTAGIPSILALGLGIFGPIGIFIAGILAI